MNRIDALKLDTCLDSLSTAELELENLWDAYRVSRDETLRNRLLVHYLPLSQSIARHMHSRMPATVELDDLAQAAILGMRSAIATFDPARGIPFENFCGSRVQRLQEMTRQMEMSTGTAPSDEQLSSALNMPVDEVQDLKGEVLPPPVRIRSTTAEDDEHAVNLELVPDRHTDTPVREAQRADLKDFLVRGLSTTERQVVTLYYYDNLSLREIGETLKLCESRVSQIHQSIIQRLRERMDRIGGATIED